MCEYCLDEWYKRNVYELKGTNDYDTEVTLSLDGERGLKIQASWNDDYRNREGEPIRMGLTAEAIIRYCPWCGRRLEGSNNV